jgi:[ribosomal protein S18]-alanine N-acetyltransferase
LIRKGEFMNWTNKEMTEEFAREILQWQYESPYDLYNNELNDEGLKELLDDTYVAVVDETNQLTGYYCTGKNAWVPAGNNCGAYTENMIDIGIGLKPDLTGAGRGRSFFTFILQHIEKTNIDSIPFRLTVASFNKRAIKLYENVGFRTQKRFESNGIPFQTMVKMIGKRNINLKG